MIAAWPCGPQIDLNFICLLCRCSRMKQEVVGIRYKLFKLTPYCSCITIISTSRPSGFWKLNLII